MARLRYNLLEAALGAELAESAETITFTGKLTAADGDVPTITGGDYLVLTIDNEIMHLTAYTSGGTTGTVEREKEGTTDTVHYVGAEVWNSPTVADFNNNCMIVVVSPDGTADRPDAAAIYWITDSVEDVPVNALGHDLWSHDIS